MKFNNPYWSERSKIELLEKWILVHSTIYYELDTNVVSDKFFDNNCKQLMELSVANDEAFINSKWYCIFKDFDGSTGFDLYKKLGKAEKVDILKIANELVNRYAKV